MPKRKRSRKRVASSKSKRARKGRSSLFSKGKKKGTSSKVVIRSPTGLPDRLFVKLKYTTLVQLTSVVGAIARNVFRGNSCYDPDLTGAGNQPYLFDQWSALYSEYIVHGSRCTVKPVGAEGVNTYYYGDWVLVPTPDSSVFVTNAQLRQQPYAKMRTCNTVCKPITTYMSTDKIFGMSKGRTNFDGTLTSAVTSNPAASWFWHVDMMSSDQATSVTQTATVEITYFTEFLNRQRPVES